MEAPNTYLFIYFIPYSSTILFKLNITTHQITEEINPSAITIGYGPNVIPLSETIFFIQGGIINGEFISDCFYYDLETKIFEEKPSGPINGGAAYTKLNEIIYIFGGASRDVYTPIELCHSFSLESEEWSPIASLPKASYNNSCGIKDEKIAIVGQHLGNLIFYDPEEDRFTEDVLIEDLSKILLEFENNLYVITVDKIRALENGKWGDYRFGGTTIFTYLYSYSAYRNGYIYFITPPQVIGRLNLETKTVEIISTNT